MVHISSSKLPFVVTKHYDFTPKRLSFGALHAQVMPWARYFQHNGKKWVTVPYEEMTQKYRVLHFGVLEVFAQCHSLHFPNGEAGVTHRNILIPPLIAQRANGSCTYRALEDSCPLLSVQAIIRAAIDSPYVFLCDGPDNASANGLSQRFIASLLKDIMNVLYITLGIVYKVFAASQNISKVNWSEVK